jgi:hypothetical protein
MELESERARRRLLLFDLPLRTRIGRVYDETHFPCAGQQFSQQSAAALPRPRPPDGRAGSITAEESVAVQSPRRCRAIFPRSLRLEFLDGLVRRFHSALPAFGRVGYSFLSQAGELLGLSSKVFELLAYLG